MAERLGIIAGGGTAPRRIAEAARAQGREVFILALEGATDPAILDGYDHAWVSIGTIGRAIDLLKRAKVRDVCMIGPVRRPSLTSLRLDFRAMKLLPKLWKLGSGDDSLLRMLIGELESDGLRVIGAHEVEGELLAPSGLMTRTRPSAEVSDDLVLGIRVARELGRLDVGQAVVVQQGQVIGVEAVEGTDSLLERCVGLRMEGRRGVLVKLKKPQQERRADLPTIGASTVAGCIKAGLAGLAVEAGQTLVMDRERCIADADAAGLFLLGVDVADARWQTA